MNSIDTNALSADQKAKLSADLAARGVKFLPGQAVRRVVDPTAKGLEALGAKKRAKARLTALRASKAAAPVALSTPAGAAKPAKADKAEKAEKAQKPAKAAKA